VAAGSVGQGGDGSIFMRLKDPATGNAFIDRLPGPTREKLFPHLREIDLSVGEQLYQQDVIPAAVYFPVRAVVSKYQMLEDGRTVEVALAGRESTVALAPAISLTGSINYCEVLTAGKALRAPAARVLELARCDPAFGFAAVRYLESQIRQVSRRIICNQYHTLEPRLACWLLMVSERRGSDVVKVTHDQIARALGYFRPTISVALESLRKLSVVKQSRGKITLVDMPGIEEIACECFREMTLRSVLAEAREKAPVFMPAATVPGEVF
jgi:CRP-like cAMP-binding protein